MKSFMLSCISFATQGIGRVCLAALIGALLPAAALAQPTYLLDTGTPTGTSIGSAAMFGTGSTSCGPQPACQAHFQYLATQFTLTEAAAISDIEIWATAFSFGGALDVKIRENINGLPSTFAPPLFSPNSIYSKRYTGLPNVFSGGQWIPFTQYSAILAAGTYWVTFEPVAGSQLNYSMAKGAPNPAAKYAFFGNGNPGYLTLPQTQAFGVRITGTTFPGQAFGTATRVSAVGSFSGFGPFDIDAVAEGTRNFTPLGTVGAPLTSSYIFELGTAHVHSRGRLFANGLSAGAYASNSTSNSAGRGVAFRTFMNMSNVAETFQINTLLDGSFQRSGGLARASVIAFDTALFSSTIAGSGKTPAHFLLDTDGLAALGNQNQSISVARFFPAAAVLTENTVAPSFPSGVVGSVPLQAGPVTLQPGETVTVLFDVAVYAPTDGSLNFSETLKPATVFFTDLGGQPVVEIVALGPSNPVTGVPATVALTPASASTPLGSQHEVTATVLSAASAPVVDANVTFAITSGPNAGFSLVVGTDSNGEAIFPYGGIVLGTDTIQATIGALQPVTASNTWAPGPLDHIVLTPAAATIPVGTSQGFAVEARDGYGNSLGDVSALATLTIAPDGSCTGLSCTATTPGAHTVTATYNGKTTTSSLTFTGSTGGFVFSGFFSPVDNAPVLNAVKAGGAVPIKFSLGGYQGLSVLAPGSPTSQPMSCDASATVDEVEETSSPGASQLSYDPATDLYTYVWKTEKGWPKSCRQLVVKLSDGSSHVAWFRMK